MRGCRVDELTSGKADTNTEERRPGHRGAFLMYQAAVFGVAAAGSIATRDGMAWYEELRKPTFTPPNWVFGPVWTVLYIGMAVAAWMVHRRPASRGALGVWWVQLALNLAWSWLFFGFRRPGMALVGIGLLIPAIGVTIWKFARRRRSAAWLLAPYLLWVCFAAALNLAIWRLNKG